MKEYEDFKAKYMRATMDGAELRLSNHPAIDLLKKNACLVEIVHGARGLAEDIFANALELEHEIDECRGDEHGH